MTPTSFSTSTVSTIAIASQGQPSRNAPSGPLLVHFLQPIHSSGSTWMRPNGGLYSSGTQNMQSSTGQYSTQAGEPAQPVQHSVMTASSLGFFLRAVAIPLERGSNFCSSGTIPGAFTASGALAISGDSTLSVKPLSARFFWTTQGLRPASTTRSALVTMPVLSDPVSAAHHVLQTVLQTSLAGSPRGTRIAPLFHLAVPLLLRRNGLLRRACPQLALSPCLRLLLAWPAACFRRARARLSSVSRRNLLPGWTGKKSGHARAGLSRSGDVRSGRRYRQPLGAGCFGISAQPCRHRCIMADGALPVHRELRRGAADGSSGDILDHAGTSD